LLEKIRGQIERLEVEEAEQVLETESESDPTPETPEQNTDPQAAVAKTLK
jgi:hypothetical protein